MYLHVFLLEFSLGQLTSINFIVSYKADFLSQLKCFTNRNNIISFHGELNEVSYKKYSQEEEKEKINMG